MSFSDKVVLVTGASSGIGAATAELFAREGAHVVAVDLDAGGLHELEDRCAGSGHTPLQLVANVADDEDARRVITETIAKCGKLDVLVNCAGIFRFASILDGNILEAYDQINKVNLRAVIHLTSLAAPYLVSNKGNIINIASVLAIEVPDAQLLAYGVSKAAVAHFTRGAALELAPHGVRVNSVSPGATQTNILLNSGMENNFEAIVENRPIKRVMEPKEIADLIVYLASDKAKGITGANYVIDNGYLLGKYN